MIKLFRNIRQKLLQEGPPAARLNDEVGQGRAGKTASYLKYAIGEIVLVVLGILIALQVNNWNDKREDSKLAEKYIKALYTDLLKDTTNINIRNREFEAHIKVTESYSKRIKQSNSPIDTILKIARYEYVGYFNPVNYFNNNTYTTLINTGDLTILDSWLQNDLTALNANQELNKQLIDVNISIYREFWAKVPPGKTNDFITDGIKDIFWKKNNTLMAEEITREMSYRIILFKNIIAMRKDVLKMTNSLIKKLQTNYSFIKPNDDQTL